MERVHPLKRFYDMIDRSDIEYKKSHIPEFPQIIEFEITNHCNFQCLMCKTGMGTALRQRGYMSQATFEKVLDEIKGRDVALKFVGQGEPLLHKEFMKFIRMAKNEGITCHLTTNGSMLNEKMMKEMIEEELDSVKFSFQGVDAEGYKTLRQKDDFEQLLKKIEKLYVMRGKEKSPFITIATSITDETKVEIREFKEKCKRIADKVEVGITTLEYIDISKVKDEKAKGVLEELKIKQNSSKKRYICCNQVFDVITIRWNGDITACCADNDGVMTLGNIAEKSIKECWNSPKQNKYREILGRNGYDELELCKDCYDVMGYMS